jgi:hypothetical protein
LGPEGNAIVMDLVPGTSLEERIAVTTLPTDKALGIAPQIAEAMDVAATGGTRLFPGASSDRNGYGTQPDSICSARCSHCGEVNTVPGFSTIEAFV